MIAMGILLSFFLLLKQALIKKTYGVYVLKAPTKEMVSLPYVDGFFLRLRWASVEPKEGEYVWREIDTALELVKTTNKRLSLGIKPGVDTPDWVYAAGAKGFTFKDHMPYRKQTFCTQQTIPIPWDSVYLEKWKKFITAFGQRYGKNPYISHVKITGVNTMTLETILPRSRGEVVTSPLSGTSCVLQDDVVNWQKEGYTRVRMEKAWKSIADTFYKAFSGKQIALMDARFPPIDDVGGIIKGKDDPVLAQRLVEYAAMTYGKSFILQNNGLSAYWVSPFVSKYAKWIATGYQMLWFVTNDSTGRMNKKVYPYDPYEVLLKAIQLGKSAGAQFVEIYEQDITNQALTDVIIEAHKLYKGNAK